MVVLVIPGRPSLTVAHEPKLTEAEQEQRPRSCSWQQVDGRSAVIPGGYRRRL